MKGKFVVIEGIEGAGKTTSCDIVATALYDYGINDILFTREPGSTPLAEKLRDLFKHGVDGEIPTSKAEVLMLYAARVQLVETVISPALNRGVWVIGDRHDLSLQAYQGGGREVDSKIIHSIYDAVLRGFRPDLTIYLDLPPTIGLQRAQKRGKADRIEKEILSFFIRTRTRYLTLAAQDASIVIIDAKQSLKQMSESIRSCVRNWLLQQ